MRIKYTKIPPFDSLPLLKGGLGRDLLVGITIATFFVLPVFLFAQTTIDYVPLAPIPNTIEVGKTTTSLPTYLTGLYKTGIAAAGILAVLMLVWGGFQYMTTEAVSGKSESKGIIQNVMWGLATVLASYLLLYTINPRLVDIGLALTNLKSVTKTRIPTAQEAYGQRLDQLLKELNDLNKQPGVIAAKAAKRALQDSEEELRGVEARIAEFIREHPDSVNVDNPDHPELEDYRKWKQDILNAQNTLKTKTAAATLAAKSIEIKAAVDRYLTDGYTEALTQLNESVKKSAAELRAAGKETEAKKLEDDAKKAIDGAKAEYQRRIKEIQRTAIPTGF